MGPGSSDEEKEWLDAYRERLLYENEMMLFRYKSDIDAFTMHCSELGIVLETDSFYFVPTIGVVAEQPGIVARLVNGLNVDKEGLINWRNRPAQLRSEPFNPGCMYSEKFIVMASPVFRRDFYKNNNWAPRFIDLFWEACERDVDAYIALDYDRVRVNVDTSFCMEADTWYGAPFSEEIASIGDGVTHLRPPSDLDEFYLGFFFNDAYALDICWNTKGEIKTFQALEFKGEGVTVEFSGERMHPARYIHAEYDLSNGCFRHFDGAIQYYTREEYGIRRDSNFRHNFKDLSKIKAKSAKAFKFNGKIPVEMWTEFCSHFFAANPLMHEYFSGTYSAHLNEALAKLRGRRENAT